MAVKSVVVLTLDSPVQSVNSLPNQIKAPARIAEQYYYYYYSEVVAQGTAVGRRWCPQSVSVGSWFQVVQSFSGRAHFFGSRITVSLKVKRIVFIRFNLNSSGAFFPPAGQSSSIAC